MFGDVRQSIKASIRLIERSQVLSKEVKIGALRSKQVIDEVYRIMDLIRPDHPDSRKPVLQALMSQPPSR
jgi:hypothetical protein